ncbi:MAG: hypothetical protein ABIZ81_12330 [Opitutaceae bacterium]
MSSTSLPVPASPASPPVPVKAGDFPTWLPPMLVKELRQGLRTRGFVGAFIVFQVIMVLLMVGTVFGSMFGTGMPRSFMANAVTSIFWTLLGAQLLLATPVRALGTLQVELDSRALDLLVLTRLTAWRIVLGKWGSLLAQALLLFVAMLPYGIVRYFMGSVDLVQDAQICAAMIAGCALLTAAGLACSGLPKIVRVLVPIVLIMGFQIIRPLMMLASGRGSVGSVFGTSMFGRSGETWLWCVNGAIILGIFLVTAVRRIAPPAENHVFLTRVLALASVLPIGLLVVLSKARLAREQLMFSVVLLGIVGAIELSSMRWPMMAHWRNWAKRGPLARWAGRFVLPGWPSAFSYLIIAGLLVGVAASLPNVAPPADRLRVQWLVVLAVSGLAFPAFVLSFFERSTRSAGALYILVFGVACLVAAMAAVLANGQPDLRVLLPLASVLPIAGFWITLLAPDQFTDNVFVWQAVIAVVVLTGTWYRARIYWDELARIDGLVRGPKK